MRDSRCVTSSATNAVNNCVNCGESCANVLGAQFVRISLEKKKTFKASEKLFNSLLPSLEWRMGGGRMGDGCGEFS